MSKDEFIPVRLSHILRHYSVGSIIRGPDFLMTVKDIRSWKNKYSQTSGRVIPYVEQVKASIGVWQDLREPPVARTTATGEIDGAYIPAIPFPSWMICPDCGLLHLKPWKKNDDWETLHCEEPSNDKCPRKPKLEQISWVMVHINGYMTDVPWHYLAHYEEKNDKLNVCRADWSENYLYLVTDSNSSRKIIKCSRCNSKAYFSNDIRIKYAKNNKQPWLPEAPEDNDELAQIIEINDIRVHSPSTITALVIPPESRIKRGTIIDRMYSSSEKKQIIDNARTRLARMGALKRIAREFRCSVEDIEEAISEIERGYPLYGQSVTKGQLYENEYSALIEELPNLSDDEDFVTSHKTHLWNNLKKQNLKKSRHQKILSAIDKLIAVHRLKEIMVFKGFQRLGGELVPPDIEGQTDWLPALELYGEGIFFSFNTEKFKRWEEQPGLKKRANDFRIRFINAGIQFDPEVNVTPRLVFLHTLSHLLIRQLETAAGYPAASLKERIYSSNKEKYPMAGILIYVAVPDIVGSLGGLYELAEPKRFLKLISKAFDHADWCSLDPVCGEHTGQGPNLLNKAACHACSLVPEPSCAFGNVLLDRLFIKGDNSEDFKPLLNC